MNRNAWTSVSAKHDMPWGIETRWAALPTITGKRLEMAPGKCTSLKFHKHKNEVLFVAKGCVIAIFASEGHFRDPVQYPAKRKELQAGALLNVQAGCPYRLCAKVNSTVYEISDGTGIEESVRIEDEYGRPIDTNVERYRFIYPEE